LGLRVEDFERAVDDREIDIVMSAIGGYSSAELLPHIDYKRVALAGKTFVGFSDVGVLLNNISFRSNIVTICGPHFSSFGNDKTLEYTEANFLNALRAPASYEIPVADTWGDESWPFNDNWKSHENLGPTFARAGEATGIAIGGSVSALVGNMPECNSNESLVVFLEIRAGHSFRDFVRWSRALLGSLPSGAVSAILCGKFPLRWDFGDAESTYLSSAFQRYTDGPIVLNLDFGHNVPFFSYPIGAMVHVGGTTYPKVTLLA
jgi:muramoyltetrapeptide carboxypeptidase LdcA involved in peptidoglycan recycling